MSSSSPNTKEIILVYFHGGGFCIGSAFFDLDHRYLNILSAQANALNWVDVAYPNCEDGIDNPVEYVETVKRSGWGGEVVEVEGEDHCFQFLDPETEKAKGLIKISPTLN